MVLSSLVAMLMASVIHLHHLQVPVVTGQDVAVAQVITPTGASPDWKVSVIGLPREALQNYYVENGLLYVNISTEKTPRLDRTFALMVRASGFQIEETGLNESLKISIGTLPAVWRKRPFGRSLQTDETKLLRASSLTEKT